MDKIKIFILVGGLGTRLSSVVSKVPKPMAPIMNQPFINYQIKEVRKYLPHNKIYLLTFHLSEVIEKYFTNDPSITIIKEDQALGTGGAIKNAINYLHLKDNEQIFILNGDTFAMPNVSKMIHTIKNDISILGSFQKNCDRYGTLTIEKNMITSFNEKEIGRKNSYINAGYYFFKNLNFFQSIQDKVFSIEKYFKTYLNHEKIHLFKYDDIFIDIGIPEDYMKMIDYIKKKQL